MPIRKAKLPLLYVIGVGKILTMEKALHRGFGDSPKTCRLADAVSLTLDLLNPKSTGFDEVSRTSCVRSFEVSNDSDQGSAF